VRRGRSSSTASSPGQAVRILESAVGLTASRGSPRPSPGIESASLERSRSVGLATLPGRRLRHSRAAYVDQIRVISMIASLRRVSSKCFSNLEIRLDDYFYVDCAFHNCCFVYSGKKKFSLTGNQIGSDCVLELRDQAAVTLSALRNLNGLGDWGRKSVAATLKQIECN
jgi:hypothetical protein